MCGVVSIPFPLVHLCSQILFSNSKEREQTTNDNELGYVRSPKRNALIREASIENITPAAIVHTVTETNTSSVDIPQGMTIHCSTSQSQTLTICL